MIFYRNLFACLLISTLFTTPTVKASGDQDEFLFKRLQGIQHQSIQHQNVNSSKLYFFPAAHVHSNADDLNEDFFRAIRSRIPSPANASTTYVSSRQCTEEEQFLILAFLKDQIGENLHDFGIIFEKSKNGL